MKVFIEISCAKEDLPQHLDDLKKSLLAYCAKNEPFPKNHDRWSRIYSGADHTVEVVEDGNARMNVVRYR